MYSRGCDNKNGIPNKTWTPGEGKCKALETEGDISYPSDHLTTMLEPYTSTKKLMFSSSYIFYTNNLHVKLQYIDI
jgi:hypothetical protein